VDGLSRPADVLTHEGDDRVANDVAVTHPLQPSYVAQTAQAAGHAQKHYAVHVKVAKYAAPCAAAGLVFRPIVFDAFGVPGKEASTFFHNAAKRQAARFNGDAAVVEQHWLQRASLSVLRGNARALLDRAPIASAYAHDPALDVDEPDHPPETFTPRHPVEVHRRTPRSPTGAAHAPEAVTPSAATPRLIAPAHVEQTDTIALAQVEYTQNPHSLTPMTGSSPLATLLQRNTASEIFLSSPPSSPLPTSSLE
jgi:hypothetical protein